MVYGSLTDMKVITRTLDTRTDNVRDEPYADLPDDLGTMQAVVECMAHAKWQKKNNSRFQTLAIRVEL